MKNSEILFASFVIAGVAGVGASLAARAFDSTPARADTEARSPAREESPAPASAAPDARALDELRMANVALQERVTSLEARLADAQGARTPVAAQSASVATELLRSEGTAGENAALAGGLDVTPDFVASVGRAMDTIKAREDAEREKKRKEMQAQRIEDRVTELQQELGLTGRQATDLRTALSVQDEKREALYASLRDESADPREMRESFRTLREETYTTLQTILTPAQFDAFKQKDESDWGRRGDFGGGPGGPGGPGGFGGGRSGGNGRPGRSADGASGNGNRGGR